jgi:hypothetical protein
VDNEYYVSGGKEEKCGRRLRENGKHDLMLVCGGIHDRN